MFRDTRVLYIIAGDKKWISTCFEDTYSKFKDSLIKLGSTLGDLFIQKAFQMAVRVPHISKEQRLAYLKHLLNVKTPTKAANTFSPESLAMTFEILKTESEILEAYERMKTDETIPDRKLRDTVLKRLSRQEVQDRTEHELQAFSIYINCTPRSMKRLINNYKITRDVALAEGRTTEREFLIRWLIIAIEWPVLAEYLEEAPDMVEPNYPNYGNAPAHILALLRFTEIKNILDGIAPHKKFTKQAINNCTGRLTNTI